MLAAVAPIVKTDNLLLMNPSKLRSSCFCILTLISIPCQITRKKLGEWKLILSLSLSREIWALSKLLFQGKYKICKSLFLQPILIDLKETATLPQWMIGRLGVLKFQLQIQVTAQLEAWRVMIKISSETALWFIDYKEFKCGQCL